MSDENTGPQHLDKLQSLMPGMRRVRAARKYVRPGSKPIATHKQFRQICDICWTPFDPALTAKPANPTLSRCTACKELLAQGWTALITVGGQHLFIKSSALAASAAGQVKIVTDEQMKFAKDFVAKKKAAPDATDGNTQQQAPPAA